MRAKMRRGNWTEIEELPEFLATAVFSKSVSSRAFADIDVLRDLGFKPRSPGTEITIFFVWNQEQDLIDIYIRVLGRVVIDDPMEELFQIIEATKAEIFGIARVFMPNIGELIETARIEAVKAIEKLDGLRKFESGLRQPTGQTSESVHNTVRGV